MEIRQQSLDLDELHRPENTGRLIVQGLDQPGIVAAVSALLAERGANIVALGQFSSDTVGGRFFQRAVFQLADFPAQIPSLERDLDERLTQRFGLSWRLVEANRPKRVAIFASKADHCVLDLLWRHRRGELPMDVRMVISNHPDLADDVRRFGIPFVHTPITAETRDAVERHHLELLHGEVDLVVLARYMRILSGGFLRELEVPVINIHHSFLPAFIGAAPYQKAKDRGVKLIGATAHYVTDVLDEGPIIEQDVVRVSHVETAKVLAQQGANVERMVLARAVEWHCADRVLRDGNTTVVL